MLKTALMGWTTALAMAALATSASAAAIFSDNFESGSLSNWTTTGTSPLTLSTARNVVPVGGANSAAITSSANRMHRNIIADNGGTELSGAFVFSSHIYDPGSASATSTRMYNEVRGYTGGTGLPNGGTTASGSLGQLLAIGKFNSVTAAGEVFNGSKYQARVVTGGVPGWFNLDAPGSPNRSAGWHEFTIERLVDGTLKFYVDDILSRTFIGAADFSVDTVIIGPGTGTSVTDSNVDGVVLIVPEPTSLAALGLAAAMIRRRRA
jgi:hypothetical protein